MGPIPVSAEVHLGEENVMGLEGLELPFYVEAASNAQVGPPGGPAVGVVRPALELTLEGSYLRR